MASSSASAAAAAAAAAAATAAATPAGDEPGEQFASSPAAAAASATASVAQDGREPKKRLGCGSDDDREEEERGGGSSTSGKEEAEDAEQVEQVKEVDEVTGGAVGADVATLPEPKRPRTCAAGGEGKEEDEEAGALVQQLDLGTAAPWDASLDRDWPYVRDVCERTAAKFREWRDGPAEEKLDLSCIRLREFPPGFWDQVQGVEDLDVCLGESATLPADVGRLGSSLEALCVRGGGPLPGAALRQLTKLEDLQLAYEEYDAEGEEVDAPVLPRELFTMESLRSLILTAPLDALPDEFFAMTQLEHLHIEVLGGRSHGLFPRVWQMTQLTALTLYGCNLGEPPLNSAVGAMVNLKSLMLGHSDELTELPDDAFGQLTGLEELYVNTCALKALPATLRQLPRLRRLSFGYCCDLERLPDEIGGCAALQELWLDGCKKLTELPPSLSRCTALETLGIADCPKLTSPPLQVLKQCTKKEFEPIMAHLRTLDAGWHTKRASASAGP